MKGYSSREVARLLGLSIGQVRSYVRSGFLQPGRDSRGRLLFSFQDVVVLRTAKGLIASRIAPRRVRRILRKLKDQLPRGRALTELSIGAEGNRVFVRDGSTRWNPESGQGLFDFDVADLARKVEPIVRRAAKAVRGAADRQTADDWYDLGVHLEVCSPEEARDAYRRAIELDPHHADAHVNLGRLLHETAALDPAEAHYRLALDSDPSSTTAAFNLGVVLEDLGREDDAIRAYETALRLDASYADAHFNIARLYERTGHRIAALRHLESYKRLTRYH